MAVKKQNSKSKKTASKKETSVKRAVKPEKEAKEKLIGKVVHYFDKLKVAVVKLKAPLSLGEKIRIEGGETDFTQTVKSMEVDREKIKKAKSGQEVGIKVSQKARDGYRVSKIL